MRYQFTDRSNQNAGRAAVEEGLKAGGLRLVAGGTRHTYYAAKEPEAGRPYYAIRVGIRAFRLVRRCYVGNSKLTDISVSKEKYHGKVTREEIVSWAKPELELAEKRRQDAENAGVLS